MRGQIKPVRAEGERKTETDGKQTYRVMKKTDSGLAERESDETEG